MINGETFKGLSSFASVKDLSRGGDSSRSPETVAEARNGGIASIVCRPAMGGTSVGEVVERVRTSRDKTGKEGMISTSRWCASARTAYSSSTLSCHHRGHQRYPRHSRPPLSKICICGRSRGATNRLVASPISRMAIITRGIKRCVRRRAVIGAPFSRAAQRGRYRRAFRSEESDRVDSTSRDL